MIPRLRGSNGNRRFQNLRDFEIRTNRVIPAMRPDIYVVVLDKKNRQLTIIDIAVASNTTLKAKEAKKKLQSTRI